MNAKSAKILCAICLVAVTSGAQADESSPYEMVNNPNGSSYVQINQNLDSFSFDSSFNSISDGNKVGYVVYAEDLAGDQLSEYMRSYVASTAEPATIEEGEVKLLKLRAGDRVSFFLASTATQQVLPSLLVASTTVETGYDANFGSVGTGGGGGSLEIRNIKVVPSGAPLPGILAVLMVGGAGAAALKLRRKRK